MYSILSTIEDATTHQILSEIAGKIALQNALFRSTPTFVHATLICVALRKISLFLYDFSIFDSFLRCFDYQRVILMENEYDILNQHQKLYCIVYISPKYFSCRNRTCGGPQGKNHEKMTEGE